MIFLSNRFHEFCSLAHRRYSATPRLAITSSFTSLFYLFGHLLFLLFSKGEPIAFLKSNDNYDAVDRETTADSAATTPNMAPSTPENIFAKARQLRQRLPIRDKTAHKENFTFKPIPRNSQALRAAKLNAKASIPSPLPKKTFEQVDLPDNREHLRDIKKLAKSSIPKPLPARTFTPVELPDNSALLAQIKNKVSSRIPPYRDEFTKMPREIPDKTATLKKILRSAKSLIKTDKPAPRFTNTEEMKKHLVKNGKNGSAWFITLKWSPEFFAMCPPMDGFTDTSNMCRGTPGGESFWLPFKGEAEFFKDTLEAEAEADRVAVIIQSLI